MAVLEQTKSEVTGSKLDALNPLASIDQALQRVFSTTQEETRLQKARSIMGSYLYEVSDEDLEIYLTEFQHLIDGWFDSFEQDMFNGATLKQVLGQS